MASIVARRRADGTTGYTAQIRIKQGGVVVHTESRTFSKKSLAKDWSKEREEQLKRDPASSARAAHRGVTVGRLIERYLSEREAIAPLGRTKHAALKMLLGHDIAQADAMRLTPLQVIEHVRHRRLSGAGAATVNGDLIWLRVVWRYARTALGVPVQASVIDDASEICRAERMTSRSRKRSRRPTDDELRMLDARFRSAWDRGRGPPMHLIMWLAIYSCRRLDELCRMRLSDWDRGGGTWLIRDLKHPDGSSGNDRKMLVPARMIPVVEALTEALPRTDDRLLPLNSRSVSAYWARQLKIFGIDDLHFHDNRREGASRLAEDGLTIPEIQQITLHDSWGSLQVYVNMKADRKRVEFEVIKI